MLRQNIRNFIGGNAKHTHFQRNFFHECTVFRNQVPETGICADWFTAYMRMMFNDGFSIENSLLKSPQGRQLPHGCAHSYDRHQGFFHCRCFRTAIIIGVLCINLFLQSYSTFFTCIRIQPFFQEHMGIDTAESKCTDSGPARGIGISWGPVSHFRLNPERTIYQWTVFSWFRKIV